MITFVHIRDPNNTGDMASCPADYFGFGPAVQVLNYSAPAPDGCVVIYGGGCMVNWLNNRPALPKATRILWGAGSSRHGATEPWPDPREFKLIGTREWTPEREAAGRWAPCVSCMSPLFDREYPVTQERVAFVNASSNIRARYPAPYNTGLPTMDNSAPMTKIVEFLGSAETVVTNSYHGALWAYWLGRQVEICGYSSKFHHINPSLIYSRMGTMRFYKRVRGLLEAKAAA